MTITDFWPLFGKRKTNATMQHISKYCISPPPELFVNSNLKRELGGILEDALERYEFDAPCENVLDPGDALLQEKTLTLREVFLGAMMGKRQTIHKIAMSTVAGGVVVFVNQDLPKLNLKGARILKSVVLQPVYSQTDIDLLRMVFANLWYTYQRQARANTLDSKLIFRMQGFHALFTEPASPQEEEIAKENRDRLIENVNEIVDGHGGIIDADDDIGLLSGLNVAENNKLVIEQIYMEAARLLKIPATRLLGRSPQGMNATGESDAKNYEMTLNRIRSGWIDPFLDAMDIAYTKVKASNLEQLEQLANMFVLLGAEPPQEFVAKLNNLVKEL